MPDVTSPSRTVHVPPERLAGWIERFGVRHGEIHGTANADTVILTATDGAVATVTVPFAPLPPGDPVAALVDHALQDRMVGAILIRRGGFAVGIFDGRQTRHLESRQLICARKDQGGRLVAAAVRPAPGQSGVARVRGSRRRRLDDHPAPHR